MPLQDQATAQKLAFDRAVGWRCVTLDGDDFNPGGTLTGGSRRAGGSTLARVFEWKRQAAELESHRQALLSARAQLDALKPAARQHAK